MLVVCCVCGIAGQGILFVYGLGWLSWGLLPPDPGRPSQTSPGRAHKHRGFETVHMGYPVVPANQTMNVNNKRRNTDNDGTPQKNNRNAAHLQFANGMGDTKPKPTNHNKRHKQNKHHMNPQVDNQHANGPGHDCNKSPANSALPRRHCSNGGTGGLPRCGCKRWFCPTLWHRCVYELL